MHQHEIQWIRRGLGKQGFYITRNTSGWWVIRDGMQPVAIVSPDADVEEWHNVLYRLKRNGWIVWPPE